MYYLLIKWGLKSPKVYSRLRIQVAYSNYVLLDLFIEYDSCISA